MVAAALDTITTAVTTSMIMGARYGINDASAWGAPANIHLEMRLVLPALGEAMLIWAWRWPGAHLDGDCFACGSQ